MIQNQELIAEKIIIEDDVWIRAGVKILRGAVIGASSVVKTELYIL